jgi:hypothetical protein
LVIHIGCSSKVFSLRDNHPQEIEKGQRGNKNIFINTGENLTRREKMLLKEIMNPNYAVNKLMSQIDFVAFSNETNVIAQRLQKKRIKPTMDNIKHYLMQCLLTPLDELPLPERKIILRSGRPERFE